MLDTVNVEKVEAAAVGFSFLWLFATRLPVMLMGSTAKDAHPSAGWHEWHLPIGCEGSTRSGDRLIEGIWHGHGMMQETINTGIFELIASMFTTAS